MRSWITGARLRKRERNESGQAVLEYVILLGITVGIVVAFTRNLMAGVDKAIPKWGRNLEIQLRAGAAPASLWDKGKETGGRGNR